MKVYVLHSTELLESEICIVRMLGVFSTVAKVIEKVKDFETNELDRVFLEFEGEPIVDNHNNGYLHAYINDDFHELYIDYREIELDDTSANIGVFGEM
mgnify:CR=1 FL=1